MVADRRTGRITHSVFNNAGEWLPENGLLVINDTKVVPSRLYGRRDTGGQVEVVVLEPPPPDAGPGSYWIECLVRPAKRIKNGDRIRFGPELEAELVRPGREGLRILKFNFERPPAEVFETLGRMPLPPYIKRETGSGPEAPAEAELDRQRYQTVYAENPGAVAAPTAGLHFTDELLGRLGLEIARLTLHVGYGTFAPVRETDVTRHRLHPERVVITEETAECVNRARSEGRPVIAVGTTTVRSLEFTGREIGRVRPYDGMCDLFIYPGFEFKVVDHLITNFHLPGSTLLMLVAALARREFILEAYRQAVADEYRFYSYGDAMLIL